MKTEKTTLITEAVFSDDGKKRYLLRKIWNEDKPSLAVVMIFPSGANAIAMDTTTQLVLNNAVRLDFGSVSIVNLFSEVNDSSLIHKDEDVENMNIIVETMKKVESIVYAPGVGKAKNKTFQRRQEQVLRILQPYEDRLHCLCDKDGNARLQHPLSPAVRKWYLSPLKVSELMEIKSEEEKVVDKKIASKKK